MAKNDKNKTQRTVDTQTNVAQNNLNNLRTDTLVPQNQSMWNNYTSDNESDIKARQNVENRFNDFVTCFSSITCVGL